LGNSVSLSWVVCHEAFCLHVVSSSSCIPRNMISYEKELDIDNKLHSYLKITVVINNVFRSQKTLKKTRIKLYN